MAPANFLEFGFGFEIKNAQTPSNFSYFLVIIRSATRGEIDSYYFLQVFTKRSPNVVTEGQGRGVFR